ncbi:hypothetical protein DIDNDMLP_00336 [Klebsiella phage KP13-7]|nr:hypothetical protein DIDNDMLP_00336 [Klebsiella phage KP13-7]
MIELKFKIQELKELVIHLKNVNDKFHLSENFMIYIPGTESTLIHEMSTKGIYSNITLKSRDYKTNIYCNTISLIRSSDPSEERIRKSKTVGSIYSSSCNIYSLSDNTKMQIGIYENYHRKCDTSENGTIELPDYVKDSDEFEALLFQYSTESDIKYNRLLKMRIIKEIYDVLQYEEISIDDTLFDLDSNDLKTIIQELKLKLC